MADEKIKVDEVSEERSTIINIGGSDFKLILTTKATKEIAGRYGGLENLGTKLMKTENFEMALDEIVWLMPIGYLMDLWECHKQFIGISKPRKEYFIDDLIPEWI